MRSRIQLLLSILILCSCGGDDSLSPNSPEALAGTYTIEGVTASSGGLNVTLTPPDIDGFLTLTTANFFALNIVASDADLDENDSGTYTINGNSLTFVSQFNPSDPFSGEILSGGSQIRIVESFVDDDELVTITVEFSK